MQSLEKTIRSPARMKQLKRHLKKGFEEYIWESFNARAFSKHLLSMMSKSMLILLMLVSFFLFQTPLFAQKPDYSGTWVLNLEKSQLQYKADGFTGSRFIIQQKGDQLKLTRYHYFGDKRKKISFKMRADGKTRTIKLLFKGKLEWQGEHLKATLSRKNFLNIVDYQFGTDTNRFIADETFTGLPQDHHNIWVFDRAL